MFSQKRKREPYTTLAQKLWLVKQREENKKISLARIAMDFSTEFNRPISISGISRIISQKDELLALSNADPEIETKRVKKKVSLNKRWLNLEIFNSEQMPSKFDKVKKFRRPEIGKYCWDATIFKGPEEAEEPEEMVNSRAEIQEESMLKVTAGFDQMHIEDDVEGIEEE